MSDLFYRTVRFLGRGPLTAAMHLAVLHPERVPRRGAAIVAPNHSSPFDVPLLISATRRNVDFVSITELMGRPWVGWFFRNMNAFPLDRRARDLQATRVLLDRLAEGRVIGMFPEGRICRPQESMLAGRAINPALLRIAAIAKTPVIPCVILGAGRFTQPMSWLPVGQTRCAVAFGRPVRVEAGQEAAMMARLRAEYDATYAEVRSHPGLEKGIG